LTPTSEWLACARVRGLLSRLDGVIESVLAVGEDQTSEVVRLLVARSGKRLRPALLLLASEYGQGDEESLLRAAAGLELLHVASLYHDDVMDRAMTRRGASSANGRWGNAVATAGGVFLFAKAFALIASTGDRSDALAGQAACRLCTGQLREVENAFNVDLTVREHLEILACKTAALFELPCQLGAFLAGCEPGRTAALVSYGRGLGLAFQLVDDALDWAGDRAKFGKATLSDIREGVYSLPLIHVLRSGGAEAESLRSRLLQRRLTEADVLEITRLVHEGGGVEAARERARALVWEAKSSLAGFPAGPALASLHALADFCVAREL
jgi:heptaprenyl diphosphate synthase